MGTVVSPRTPQNILLADPGKGNDISSGIWRLPVKRVHLGHACMP